MIRSHRTTRRSKIHSGAPRGHRDRASSRCRNVQTRKIPVTLAERPHPFPSRTRKLSSPAPKILRGQPFGKIGRRRDFCVSGHFVDPRSRRGPVGRVPAILDPMTAVEPQARATRPPLCPADSPPGRPVTGICPYLAAADGAWRSTTVAREHRCGAVAPPAAARRREAAPAVPDRRPRHLRDLRGRPRGAADRVMTAPPTLPRPLARTTPLVLDHGRIAVTMPALRGDRMSGQAVLDRPARPRLRGDPPRAG